MWEVIKDLREQNLSQGADNPWAGSGLGPAILLARSYSMSCGQRLALGIGHQAHLGCAAWLRASCKAGFVKKELFGEQAIVFFMYLDVAFVLSSLTNSKLLLFTSVKC